MLIRTLAVPDHRDLPIAFRGFSHRTDFDPPSFWMWQYSQAAEFLIGHGWQPTRGIELVKQARASHERDLDGLMLRAAKQAGLWINHGL